MLRRMKEIDARAGVHKCFSNQEHVAAVTNCSVLISVQSLVRFHSRLYTKYPVRKCLARFVELHSKDFGCKQIWRNPQLPCIAVPSGRYPLCCADRRWLP